MTHADFTLKNPHILSTFKFRMLKITLCPYYFPYVVATQSGQMSGEGKAGPPGSGPRGGFPMGRGRGKFPGPPGPGGDRFPGPVGPGGPPPHFPGEYIPHGLKHFLQISFCCPR